MSSRKSMMPVGALAIMALAATGCMAQGADDEVMDEPEIVVAPDQGEDATAEDESTGESQQAWLGWGGRWGGRWGGFGWPGFGFGGCGLGFGGLGFGGCGLGFPFFGYGLGCGGCW